MHSLIEQSEQDTQDNRLGGISLSYNEVVRLLGEPNREDDPYKVDASWRVRTKNGGHHICVWNYKNGPAYGYCNTVEEIDFFSVWWENKKAREAAEVIFGSAL